jgi:hypothetical protein
MRRGYNSVIPKHMYMGRRKEINIREPVIREQNDLTRTYMEEEKIE